MPSTDWKEVVAPDEGERFERYSKQIADIQAARAKGGAQTRGFHPKRLLSGAARFTVLPDLPDYARQGLFAEPRSYDAWVRYSNGAIKVQSDHRGDIRGLVVKVHGVQGEKAISALGAATTQDFSMIQTPFLTFRTADEFMWFVGVAQNPLLLLPKLFGRFGVSRTLWILRTFASGALKFIPTLANVPFYNPMPIQWGPYAVHYSVHPVVTVPLPPKSSSKDFLGEDLAARLKKGAIDYDFKVQFFVDEQKTPIEDTSILWKVEDAPMLTVARLTVLQQDVGSPEGLALSARIEASSFNPWHALKVHKPLGDMMRARDPAYVVSTTNRGAVKEA